MLNGVWQNSDHVLCVPGAFVNDSKRGTYVQAGAFPDRSSAESLSQTLRSQGMRQRNAPKRRWAKYYGIAQHTRCHPLVIAKSG